MLKIPRRPETSIRMEMSPLIDCVFLLLVFFMLSSTFLTPAIQLDLPALDANAKPPAVDILVTVDRQGQAYVNKQPVDLEQLADYLRKEIASRERAAITFRGDKQMPYELFVRALEAIKASGVSNLSVAHERSER